MTFLTFLVYNACKTLVFKIDNNLLLDFFFADCYQVLFRCGKKVLGPDFCFALKFNVIQQQYLFSKSA